MNKELINKLIEEAKDIALSNFCCNYTNFTVGVALLTTDGKIYKGFNIENHGIQSICGERVAFSKALSEGNSKFVCMAVVGKKLKEKEFIKTLPCGYCRQFISEYATSDFTVYTYDDKEQKLYTYKMKDLLPESYDF